MRDHIEASDMRRSIKPGIASAWVASWRPAVGPSVSRGEGDGGGDGERHKDAPPFAARRNVCVLAERDVEGSATRPAV